ncbi:MoaD family protein [Candidatus Thorarchaeota archaeon]|nr:MAG: MoaD family protein [Candidatus Thorarchaeota archaeon]
MPEVTVKLFATVREKAGKKSVEMRAANVGELLEKLKKKLGPEFEKTVFDPDTGELKRFFSVMVNGKRIETLDGRDTELELGDTIAIFPPVGGG